MTEPEISVLEKGLNFGITEKCVNKESLLDDVYKFQRKLKLREYFSKSDDTSNHSSDVDMENQNGILLKPVLSH